MSRGQSYPEDLRERLIAAAAERLASAPPEALSLRALAKSQGTSTNAIYSLFGSKPALISAVIARTVADFENAQRAAIRGATSLEALRRGGLAYRKWALEHPALYRLLLETGLRDPLLATRAKLMNPLADIVEQLVADGDLIDAPVDELCRVLWAATHGFVLMEMTENLDPEVGEVRYRGLQLLLMRGLLSGAARHHVL